MAYSFNSGEASSSKPSPLASQPTFRACRQAVSPRTSGLTCLLLLLRNSLKNSQTHLALLGISRCTQYEPLTYTQPIPPHSLSECQPSLPPSIHEKKREVCDSLRPTTHPMSHACPGVCMYLSIYLCFGFSPSLPQSAPPRTDTVAQHHVMPCNVRQTNRPTHPLPLVAARKGPPGTKGGWDRKPGCHFSPPSRVCGRPLRAFWNCLELSPPSLVCDAETWAQTAANPRDEGGEPARPVGGGRAADWRSSILTGDFGRFSVGSVVSGSYLAIGKLSVAGGGAALWPCGFRFTASREGSLGRS